MRKKILVVEDFEPFRQWICSILQLRAEFQVTGVSDGLEALRIAEELQPDLILLDIGLPKLNGLEVARRVRQVAPVTRILFLSQESSREVVREALDLGGLGYVHKPHAHGDLLLAVDAVLGGRPFVSSNLEFGADSKPRHDVELHEHNRFERNDNLVQLRSRLEEESDESIKLLNDIVSNPICSVTVDESVPCVFVIWKQYATSAQLRFIHECILELIKRHAVTKVLGDDTRLPAIHSDDQRWIIEDWLPRAVAAGLRFCCSKDPDAHFGKVAVSNVLSAAPAGIIARRFDVLDDARHWLRDVGNS